MYTYTPSNICRKDKMIVFLLYAIVWILDFPFPFVFFILSFRTYSQNILSSGVQYIFYYSPVPSFIPQLVIKTLSIALFQLVESLSK